MKHGYLIVIAQSTERFFVCTYVRVREERYYQLTIIRT